MLAGAELPLLRRGARLTNGQPSGGVSDAQVAGRDVELIRGCTEESEHTILVEEARRLVEVDDVDAVVGAIGESDAIVFREIARQYPDVVFISVWSGAQGLTLRHPAANVYRFDTDEAQDVAGLGSYAYRELGWRRAAIVADTTPVGWHEEAAFVAEFCALGGEVTARFTAPIDLGDPKVARRSSGRRRRRRADVRRALRARRLSAQADPAARLAPDPARRRDICARGLQHNRAHRPTRRGGWRVVDPTGKRNPCDAGSAA